MKVLNLSKECFHMKAWEHRTGRWLASRAGTDRRAPLCKALRAGDGMGIRTQPYVGVGGWGVFTPSPTKREHSRILDRSSSSLFRKGVECASSGRCYSSKPKQDNVVCFS
jgi:hypothetical protein